MESISEARDGIPETEVRAALDRLVASYVFRMSPQLSAFLRFVVDATLRGEAERIKGYTIAVEALGRGDSFDPQADPIVRVEAGRLRRTLEHYYAGLGAQEPIIIDLPRGSYVPRFRRRDPAPDDHRRIGSLRGAATTARTNHEMVGPFQTGNGFPVLFVQPFETAGTPSATAISPSRLRGKLRDAFARFDEINVVSELAPTGGQGTSSMVGLAPSSRYQLSGSGEYGDDGTVLTLRLIDASDGTIVWSRIFGPSQTGGKPGQAEDRIAREVATALAQPLGVVHAFERGKQYDLDPRHSCVIATYDYLVGTFDDPGNQDSTVYARLRGNLERVTKVEPTFALGFAMLTWVYLREHHNMAPAQPGDTPALDRALKTAQRAVALKPQSSRAHQALFVASFARGEIAAAFAEGELALSLNPFDPFVVSGHGRRLVAVGEIDKGVAMLTEASASSAVKSAWLDFFLFLAAYLRGDLPSASRHAFLDMNGAHPLGIVARTLAAAAAGDSDGARKSAEQLVTTYPVWRDHPWRTLEKFVPSREIVDRLIRDLAAAQRPTGRA